MIRSSCASRASAHALIPAPLRRHALNLASTWSSFGTWLWALVGGEMARGIFETLVLSQLAAVLAAIAALVLFPAVSQRFNGRIGRAAGRGVLVLLRGTPDYVMAYILLQLLGPSMLPAILALGLHNGGIIAFLMGRHADELSYRRDAPRALDLYAYETVPRLYGQFLALVLYRYEIIVRESAILGILGNPHTRLRRRCRDQRAGARQGLRAASRDRGALVCHRRRLARAAAAVARRAPADTSLLGGGHAPGLCLS